MTKRMLLAFPLLACLGAAGPLGADSGVSPVPGAPAARPPNIVIVFTDDQGYGDLGCFGSPVIRTPHVDALARAGMKLTQFYVASPVCSPSRAALLTGCYPKRVGMERHVVFPPDDWGLHPDEETIAEMLGAHGYVTGCFGKWHLGHRDGLLPTDQGFDEFFGVPYSNDMSQFHRGPGNKYKYSLPLLRGREIIEWEPDQRLLTRRYTEEAIAFIERHRNEPFLVYLPHSMPHIPIYASEEFEGTSPRGRYGDVIEEIDASVGALRAALDRLELAEDTLFVFTSDNGPWLPFKEQGGSAGPLRGGKGSNWEGGQRVPCVVAWPGHIPPGTTRTDVTTTMDLMPTIAALAGVERRFSRTIDGRDIAPLLHGAIAALPPRDFVYYTSKGELAGIRRGPWKLLLGPGALYHLELDVGEQWNRAERHPEIVAELRAAALAFDAELTAEARPRGQVAEPLWSPAERHRPFDGTSGRPPGRGTLLP